MDGRAIRLVIDPDLPEVRADAAQLERAFANLLENAARYSAGRPVSVQARGTDTRLLVRIVDQGPGIDPAEHRADLRALLPRAAPGRDRWAGSGLGLAIAKGFVEANGGTIAVESLPGQGTSFIVSLPTEPAGHDAGMTATAPACAGVRRRAADPAGAEGDPARRRL